MISSLSVVIPAYNEEPNIAAAIKQVSDVLQTLNLDYEIIVAIDGSKDQTPRIAKALLGQVPCLRVVEQYPNRGYGAALKLGFKNATKDWIVFFPSDNQFRFDDIHLLMAQADGAAIVSGYRGNRQDPFIRKLNGFGWNLVVRLLFGHLARDIDCGFKLFKREILDQVTLESNGAMIDTELLAGAKLRGYRIAEVPVTHLPRTAGNATGANLRVIIKAFRDYFHIRLRLMREIKTEKAQAASEVR